VTPGRRLTFAVLAWVFLLLAPAARAGLPVQPDPDLEAKVDSLIRVAVDHAFAGRLDIGFAAVDLAAELAPRDPRIGITRFRLLRENYPVGVYQKKTAREQEPALLRELERTIAICDSMLEVNDKNPAAYMYRGWAYINKAQTHLIARRMRATAGASRKGKSDFDKFYEYHPQGDPDAATVLGAYLFYADTLPGFFKFIRWLIRVPGGDREKGLELLREGAAGRGYTYPDAELVLAVTYYLFDGDFENSRQMLQDARKSYARHPWVVEYSSSLAFLHPEMTGSTIASLTGVVDGWGENTRGWDESVRYRLTWSRAQMYRQLGGYDRALEDMEQLVDESPAVPFWVAPHAHVAAIELAGDLGRTGDVDRLCRKVPDDQRYRGVRDRAESACGRASDSHDAAVFAALCDVRVELYSGRVDEADDLLRRTIGQYGDGINSRYLEAEVARCSGRPGDALEIYADVEDRIARATKKPKGRSVRRGRDAVEEETPEAQAAQATNIRVIRVQTLLHMGEICIERRDYEGAMKFYEKAKDVEPRETMYANMIRGRIRYIERQTD
jgi:tetratricopeptide (TPR) repeat protein